MYIFRDRISRLPRHLYHRHHLQTDQDAHGYLRERRPGVSKIQIVLELLALIKSREYDVCKINSSLPTKSMSLILTQPRHFYEKYKMALELDKSLINSIFGIWKWCAFCKYLSSTPLGLMEKVPTLHENSKY